MFVATLLLAGALVGQPETPASDPGDAPTCWFGDAYAASGGELCSAEEADDAVRDTSETVDAEETPPARSGCDWTQSERRDPATGAIERSIGISCTGGSDDPRTHEELERVRRSLQNPMGDDR